MLPRNSETGDRVPPRLFDAHCHLDFPGLRESLTDSLLAAKAAGVSGLMVPGVDPAQWARSAELEAPGFALARAAGLHPWALLGADHADVRAALDALPAALERLGAAAVGECGWDRPLARRGGPSLARQDEVAQVQLALARDRKLPVILHVVGCYGYALERVAAAGPLVAGMIHAYSASAELVPAATALKLFLSFGPSITRPDARRLHRSLSAVPDEALLVETDAPDQAPIPRGRGEGRPADLRQVVGAVAKVRGASFEAVAERTRHNARRLFGLR